MKLKKLIFLWLAFMWIPCCLMFWLSLQLQAVFQHMDYLSVRLLMDSLFITKCGEA